MQLNGLLLSGGKSKRMSEDKAALSYHAGMDQIDYNIKLLESVCDEVYLSCSKEQTEQRKKKGYKIIEDSYPSNSPTTGILSAQSFNPNAAWLVLACDLPYLDLETIKDLVANRNPLKEATTYMNPLNNWPEPLCTIYEPRIFEKLESFFLANKPCPRKVLFNSQVEELSLKNKKALENVNTPIDRIKAMHFLKRGIHES